MNIISYLYTVFKKEKLIRWLYLTPGDWDLNAKPYSDFETYQKMAQIYDANYDYQQTELYQKIIDQISTNGKFKHKSIVMRSIEEAEKKYFDRYVKVFNSMEKDGYLRGKGVDDGFGAIDRNGKVVKMQRGRHRLSIAKLVGIESIPINVLYIHPEWVEKVSGKSDNYKLEDISACFKASQELYI